MVETASTPPRTYFAIRTVKVVSKGLKSKAEHPILLTQSVNEKEKFPFQFNSTEELESFRIGQELRVRLEPIPTRTLEETPKPASPIIEPSNPCPNGVFADDMGKSEFCLDCENRLLDVCSLSKDPVPEEGFQEEGNPT